VLAILYGAGAIGFGLLAKVGVDSELSALAVQGEKTPIQVQEDGRTTTVGEYRKELYSSLMVFVGMNLGLSAAFFVCFFITKQNPVRGTVAAFGIFILVIAIGAVLDPTSVWKGIIIKVFAVIALSGGMRSAFAEVAAQKPGAEPGRRSRGARATKSARSRRGR